MAVDSKKREQINISLTNDSSLASKLREAEEMTGQSRTQIARAVLDSFLDTWLQVEQTRQRLVDAAKAATRNEDIVVASIHDLGPLKPPSRGDSYQPAPDYWKVVQARRPIPLQVVETFTNVPIELAPPQQPPVRLAEVDESFFDDVADDRVI